MSRSSNDLILSDTYKRPNVSFPRFSSQLDHRKADMCVVCILSHGRYWECLIFSFFYPYSLFSKQAWPCGCGWWQGDRNGVGAEEVQQWRVSGTEGQTKVLSSSGIAIWFSFICLNLEKIKACRGDEQDYGILPKIEFPVASDATDASSQNPPKGLQKMGARSFKEPTWEDM